ncbi:MAG: hypothetical protein INR70_30840 [Parafilimonas terrae]|nr:hypothetical protein [Parafilimonas terrae]
MRKSMVGAVLAFSLAGCVSMLGPVDDTPIAAQFDAGAMAPIMQRGSASISGQASMKGQDGTVAPAAGAKVLLWPATPFTHELAQKMAAGQAQTAANAQLQPYARSTVTDAGGTFGFYGLPAGAYVVVLPFQLQSSTEDQTTSRAGALWQEVSVKDNQQGRVALSGNANPKAKKAAP